MNPKAKMIVIWILRAVVAVVFLMTGGNKLLGSHMMVEEFGKIGLGQGFRYLVGLIEVGDALLILWPRTSFYGAVLLLCVIAGAFVTQLFVLHGDVIHVFVFAAVVGALAWLQRPGSTAPAEPLVL